MENKFDLDDDLKEYIDSKDDVSKFINKCIREAKEKESTVNSECIDETKIDKGPTQSITNTSSILQPVYS